MGAFSLKGTMCEQKITNRLTASEEVCRQADLIRGMREFFMEGYSIRLANVGMMFRHSSCSVADKTLWNMTFLWCQVQHPLLVCSWENTKMKMTKYQQLTKKVSKWNAKNMHQWRKNWQLFSSKATRQVEISDWPKFFFFFLNQLQSLVQLWSIWLFDND